MAIQRRMRGGQTDNNEVDLMDEAGFAHWLTTIQVIAEYGGVDWCKEIMMGRDTPFGSGGFTILVLRVI
ncbi:hypothetical protein [Leptolyngbya sp. CCY15150]|uniref:hypothetical protein n=1 Tax=Leptolyngbya sp. CCY15150 TaxID=2767772 RepID=UPI00194FB1A9|nr:hypothetical protein [Leptolyngbya sp. CCY15150]